LTSNPQNTALNSPSGAPDKAAAKQCLLAADRFLKESRFHEARTEIEKAKKLDPANVYVIAFLDRINYFEAQKKKEAGPAVVPPPVVGQPGSVAPPVAAPLRTAAPPVVAPPRAPSPPAVKPTPVVAPPSPPQKPGAQAVPAPPLPVAGSAPSPSPIAVPHSPKPREVPAEPAPSPAEQKAMEATLEEMKRQIQMLSHSLEQEKKAREEMTNQQLDSNVRQLRHSMEKAWLNGAPSDAEGEELHKLAMSLSIPENVEQSLRREVKLKMYSNAVKEVIAKRQLLRSSSSTFEWLRKVYQVTMEEYLEYETKFLLDLVADQYKGTVLYVSPNVKSKDDLVPRLKAAGYAVVLSGNPEEALEKIEKVNPNIILCHTEFSPGSLSGIKFLHLLRATVKFNFIPFILLCQESEVSQLQSSELRQHEGYLKKPVDIDELMITMNEKLAHFRDYVSSLS
jgi:CheY-like chemotaxis protein